MDRAGALEPAQAVGERYHLADDEQRRRRQIQRLDALGEGRRGW